MTETEKKLLELLKTCMTYMCSAHMDDLADEIEVEIQKVLREDPNY